MQFFGTSEHYGKAQGGLLSGWMNYNYTACCWFPTSSNILILPSQFWQIGFESYWLHSSKCRILVLLWYIITQSTVQMHWDTVYEFAMTKIYLDLASLSGLMQRYNFSYKMHKSCKHVLNNLMHSLKNLCEVYLAYTWQYTLLVHWCYFQWKKFHTNSFKTLYLHVHEHKPSIQKQIRTNIIYVYL